MSKEKSLKKIIKIWIMVMFTVFNVTLIPNNIYAQNDNDLEVDWFNIMPELTESQSVTVNERIETIWKTWWNVRNEYNKAASSMSTSEQISSWIMNWDTIMHYLVFVVQFLSQLWLIVWAWFIMYAWYMYMLSIFKGSQTKPSIITNAIIWVVIVIFSYAILKTLTSVAGLS